MEKGEG